MDELIGKRSIHPLQVEMSPIESRRKFGQPNKTEYFSNKINVMCKISNCFFSGKRIYSGSYIDKGKVEDKLKQVKW